MITVCGICLKKFLSSVEIYNISYYGFLRGLYLKVKTLCRGVLDLETREERNARIYPIILSEYNQAWPVWYAEEKKNLERLIGKDNIARISHFGSTSVPGLTAKPTVDILLEIAESASIESLITALSDNEYICLRQQTMESLFGRAGSGALGAVLRFVFFI